MGRQQASKLYKTKRKSRDADQILNDDLKTQASIQSLEKQKFDEYLPGLGQFYCVVCAKYFESAEALDTHKRSKVHKRALKNLKFGPYTAEEAAAGAGRDVAKYLQKQQQQAELLKAGEAAHLLYPEQGTTHKKRKHKAGKMEIEAEPVVVETEIVTEEISV